MKRPLNKVFPFSSFQCLRLLMHTFNREYSQVSSSASESKVSPSLGPLTRPVNLLNLYRKNIKAPHFNLSLPLHSFII